MFTYEYRFYPKSFDRPDIDEFDDKMQWFISSLCKNGQILLDYQNTVKFEDFYACRVVALEIDSLSEKYSNKYTTQFLKEVNERSIKFSELIYIGENYDVENCCTCKSSSHYILATDCLSNAPPILCGDCQKSVPLYKFPKTYYNLEYYDLLGWQKVYQSCDRQFLERIGGHYGYKMMHNVDSALSKEALRYCRVLEEKVNKPFYYFLFNYYNKNKLFCPKCGKLWINQKIETIYKVHYDCVCHRCRLVSNNPY